MPGVALTGICLYLLIAFGWRTLIHWKATGSTGFHGIDGPVGSAGWFGGVLFVIALLAALGSPLAALAGWLPPVDPLDHPGGHLAGIVLGILGTAATFWSQMAMGDAWRIGVAATEHTRLVRSGPFARVRNPIFSSMVVSLAGLVLLTPNVLAIIALTTLLIALELQVRCVEEPYLLRTQGAPYRRYAATTGRFFPGIGRLINRDDPGTAAD